MLSCQVLSEPRLVLKLSSLLAIVVGLLAMESRSFIRVTKVERRDPFCPVKASISSLSCLNSVREEVRTSMVPGIRVRNL